MKYGYIKHKLLWTANFVAAIFMVLLAGCVNDGSDCPLPVDDVDNTADSDMTLQFTVVTRTAARDGSRALIDPGQTQVGTIAENFLDLRNLTFLLFDDQRRLISPFYPDVEVSKSDYSAYIVTTSVPKTLFDYAEGDNVTFYIMVLGNMSRLSPQRLNFTPEIGMQRLFAADFVGTFLQPTWDVAMPSLERQQYIPMSGLQEFSVSRNAIAQSTRDVPYKLFEGANGKDINMLRAMAKIEIVDCIDYNAATQTQPDINSRPSLEKVEVMGYFSRGAILPTFEDWNRGGTCETQYVRSVAIPEGSGEYKSPVAFSPGATYQNVIWAEYDAAATERRADKCRVYSAYVTEYSPQNIGTGNIPAWVCLTITNPFDNVSELYELKLMQYVNGAPAPGSDIDILRNTIYRYEINSVGVSTDLNVVYTVCDWSNETVNIPPFN